MIVLGLSGALNHDPSAAIMRDGELLAAAEEERFTRDKHAKNSMPLLAAQYCLEQAGIAPEQIDMVAFPYAKIPLSRGRWHFAKRYYYAPERALDALFFGNRRFYRNKHRVIDLMNQLGINPDKTPFVPVEHHLAHASSAYHLSGFKERTAIVSIDGKGEYATTFFGIGEAGKIYRIKEFYDPDSIGGVYGALTEFLGFDMLDGEFKVMGMAPYGNPNKYDFSELIKVQDGKFKVDTRLVNTVGLRRYKDQRKGYYFSPKLIEWLGPKREGDEIDEPYIDYAASIQALLEKVSLSLIEHHLGDVIRETGKVCFAGGVALNVKLNQKIIALPEVKELFVQPAASDAGTAVGAASYVSATHGICVKPMQHAYLGPKFTTTDCVAACQQHTRQPHWQIVDDPAVTAAKLLSEGHPVAWFQGRMEFGPRALGNRSILGHPAMPGMAERINAQIKYRERWRPFCPSMLDIVAKDILGTDHPAPYMTFSFPVDKQWKEKIPEVVHEDGTVRAQIVTEAVNPRYYRLIQALQQHGGHGVVLNTSLNRRGEPMVCSPTDALNMFFGCDLQYLVMEDVLVTKV